MPDFARAEITSTTDDLTHYKNFLRKLTVGQVVRLPLAPGDTSRKVMRALNTAAAQAGMRLTRLSADESAVRFRVVPTERRSVNVTPEARQARIEKARATKQRNQQAAGAAMS